MEILLQNAGVLTSLERAPLKMKKKDLCFRNLDATATLTKLPDLKGKTITNVAKVTGFKLIRGSMAIHRFECSLSTKQDGVFYKCETSLVGSHRKRWLNRLVWTQVERLDCIMRERISKYVRSHHLHLNQEVVRTC